MISLIKHLSQKNKESILLIFSFLYPFVLLRFSYFFTCLGDYLSVPLFSFDSYTCVSYSLFVVFIIISFPLFFIFIKKIIVGKK